jgi:hypothetical protein
VTYIHTQSPTHHAEEKRFSMFSRIFGGKKNDERDGLHPT